MTPPIEGKRSAATVELRAAKITRSEFNDLDGAGVFVGQVLCMLGSSLTADVLREAPVPTVHPVFQLTINDKPAIWVACSFLVDDRRRSILLEAQEEGTTSNDEFITWYLLVRAWNNDLFFAPEQMVAVVTHDGKSSVIDDRRQLALGALLQASAL